MSFRFHRVLGNVERCPYHLIKMWFHHATEWGKQDLIVGHMKYAFRTISYSQANDPRVSFQSLSNFQNNRARLVAKWKRVKLTSRSREASKWYTWLRFDTNDAWPIWKEVQQYSSVLRELCSNHMACRQHANEWCKQQLIVRHVNHGSKPSPISSATTHEWNFHSWNIPRVNDQD